MKDGTIGEMALHWDLIIAVKCNLKRIYISYFQYFCSKMKSKERPKTSFFRLIFTENEGV